MGVTLVRRHMTHMHRPLLSTRWIIPISSVAQMFETA